MITSAADFNSAASFVKSEVNLSVLPISDLMKSAEYNRFYTELGTSLNTLYEKTRVLEDMTQYCHDKILSEVTTSKEQIDNILNQIESSVDSYLNKDFIAVPVPLNTLTAAKDRDGSELPISITKKAKLIMPGTTVKEAAIKSVVVERERGHYQDNSLNFPYGNPYRVVYTIEEPIDSIEETFTVLFHEPINCNYISVDTANCDIVEAKIINENSAEVVVDIAGNYIQPTMATGMKLKLRSTKCEKQTVSIDAEAFSRDTWETLLNDNAVRYFNSDGLKAPEDEMATYNQLQNAETYENNVSSWFKLADSIEQRNKMMSHVKDQLPIDDQVIPTAPAPTGNQSIELTRYVFYFGIDLIEAAEKIISSKAGVLINLQIGKCSKIELEADIVSADGTAVEFYIIDGSKELPILPYNQSTIDNETVFFGQNTRFPVDKNDNVVVKCDGTVINIDAEGAAQRSDGLYTISYNPVIDSCKPTNATAIKIVQRFTGESKIPPTVNRILIHKYGGEAPWMM